MTDKIGILADASTVLGFRLAGVQHAFTATPESADAQLTAALQTSDLGILIITTDLLHALSHKNRKLVDALTKPVVVAIPARGSKVGGANDIAQKIKRAIGVELK